MRVKREPQIILYGWGMVIRDELSETVWHFSAPSAVGDIIEQKYKAGLNIILMEKVQEPVMEERIQINGCGDKTWNFETVFLF